jgi:hypothetical protein
MTAQEAPLRFAGPGTQSRSERDRWTFYEAIFLDIATNLSYDQP